MAKNKEPKTNAMRILDRMKISYKTFTYECDEFTDAQHTADLIGAAHETMFKTLVTVSPEPAYYVFVIPIDSELDLKKCAHQAGVKSLAMIHVKDINSVTGYIRGGCTAIGMKKQYPVFIAEAAQNYPQIVVSGGHLGIQIELAPQDLAKEPSAISPADYRSLFSAAERACPDGNLLISARTGPFSTFCFPDT